MNANFKSKGVSRAEKAAAKRADARIDAIYNTHCSNVEIMILDIPKVFKVGRDAIAAGANDVELTAKIVEFVNTIRKN